MAAIIEYKFGGQKVCNPDGSLPVHFKNIPPKDSECPGPGDCFGQHLPSSICLGSNGYGNGDVSSFSKKKYSRFHVCIIFKFPSCVRGTQTVVESECPPFKVILLGNGKTTKLAAALGNEKLGWLTTQTVDTPNVTCCDWHCAEIVFDIDTISVFLDKSFISNYGIGTSTLLSSVMYSDKGKVLTIGSSKPKEHFNGNIASLKVCTAITPEMETKLDHRRSSAQWYITSRLETVRTTVGLGNPTGPINYDPGTFIWTQKFTAGAIMYYTGHASAFELHGEIYEKYQTASTAEKTALGPLVSDESPATNPVGRKSVFKGGAIYWSSATGAWIVTGQIFLDYEHTGESREWGFPIEAATYPFGGTQQRMQNATWFHRTGAPNAHEVHGNILSAFLATGGLGRWGWPITDEQSVLNVAVGGPNRNVRSSEFEGCLYLWSSTTGAHEVDGDVREVYIRAGGPQGNLGLPTTDRVPIPGGPNNMTGFEGGTICWFGSLSGTQIVFPFKIFLGNINSDESEGFLMGENDLYFRVDINVGNTTVFRQRYPSSGDFGGDNNRDFEITFPPRLVPNPSEDITFIIDVWESDSGAPFGGGDDKIGKWTKVLNAANAWGLNENDGILDSGSFSKINNIRIAIQPDVDPTTLTDVQKWWGVDNRKTDSLSYSSFAQAFRDVDSDTEWWDIGDGLKSLFYELVIEECADSGNCFGMSLEAIYARKQRALEALPLDRFTDNPPPSEWETVRPQFNVKHQWQFGASSVWFFLGQLASGNTHNPVSVFRETRDAFGSGKNPVLCLTQNYDFSGKPHVVMPIAWNQSVEPWTMTICDPNFPSGPANGVLQTLSVDPSDNSYTYLDYSGTRWSGGRLYYIPFEVLDNVPRTPVWEAILLILAGTVIILGSDSQTDSITDASGNDISSHGDRATEALQHGRTLSGFFSKTPNYEGLAGEILCSGKFAAPPVVDDPVVLLRVLSLEDESPSSSSPLDVAEVQPPKGAQNFVHTFSGKNNGALSHVMKSAGFYTSIKSDLARDETTTVKALSFGTNQATFGLTQNRGKSVKIVFSQRLGVSQDTTTLEFGLTTTAAGEFNLFPRPGLQLVDIFPGSTKLSKAKVTATTIRNGTKTASVFDLDRSLTGCDAFRLKMNLSVLDCQIVFAKLSVGDYIEVLGSEVIEGTPVQEAEQ